MKRFAAAGLLATLALSSTAVARAESPAAAEPETPQGHGELFARDTFHLDSVVCPFKGEIDYEPGGIDCFLLEVPENGLDRLVPGRLVQRGILFRPVAVGELRRHVLRIDAVLQDVPLADAEVLQQAPGRMGTSRRLRTTKLGGKSIDRRIKIQVGTASLQQVQNVRL